MYVCNTIIYTIPLTPPLSSVFLKLHIYKSYTQVYDTLHIYWANG